MFIRVMQNIENLLWKLDSVAIDSQKLNIAFTITSSHFKIQINVMYIFQNLTNYVIAIT